MNINVELYRAAIEASTHSYSPYSHYKVGVAAKTESGKIVVGCNVENESYGLTLCAECILIGNLKLEDAGKILEFVCVNGNADIITPCGRCRQLLFENSASSETKIAVPPKDAGEALEAFRAMPEFLTFELPTDAGDNASLLNDLVSSNVASAKYVTISELLPYTWRLE